jgi:hypothetical protein
MVLAGVALLAGLGSAGAAEPAPTLERGLVQQAPALIKLFKARGYKNVGVLKFLVARSGSKGFSDNVGTLNLLLARRLQVALVLANDPSNPVGIIRNASAVAARTRGANHLNASGRKRLFAPDYPLAWGDKQVKADAFVTGIAQVSADLRTIDVSLLAFARGKTRLEPVGKDFTVRNDAGKLAEMNESFALRGAFDDGTAVKTAARIKEKKASHPVVKAAELPVRLDVLYDGRLVKPVIKGGKAFLPEPREGQKVVFRLRRDSGTDTYGVVLKVNGENTIAKQRQPDLYCRRWILRPGSGPRPITGYQINDREQEVFRVLSAAESKSREMNYGADVGTISLTVFRQRSSAAPPPDPLEAREEKRARVVATAKLPEKKESLGDLKKALLEEANEGEVRGLIGEGKRKKKHVKKVTFNPDPTPVMSITLIYYRR